MFTGMEWLLCPNLAVSAATMRPVVQVESGGNPFAIGVVGGRLERQPQSLAEAVATARSLDAAHRDYALGLAQVSRGNLRRAGLTTYEQAFAPCANLAAGAKILADCHARARGHWGRAFSCYYAGDFVTGYRNGYVRKVYAAMESGDEGTAGTRAPGSRAHAAARDVTTQADAAAARRAAARQDPETPATGPSRDGGGADAAAGRIDWPTVNPAQPGAMPPASTAPRAGASRAPPNRDAAFVF